MLDIVGVALFLIGAICYGSAYLGMKRLRDAGFVPAQQGQPFGAVAEWIRWNRLSWIGLTFAAVGVAVSVTAAIVAVRIRRRAQSLSA